MRSVELEARLSFSSREVLQRMDFDTMSAAELAQAQKMIAELRLPLPWCARAERSDREEKRIDLRATLRETCAKAATSSRSCAPRRASCIRRWSCCATSPGR